MHGELLHPPTICIKRLRNRISTTKFKDGLGYPAQVAQMNGEIDTDYCQRPQIFEILYYLCCRETVIYRE